MATDLSFAVLGMSCAACSNYVEKALTALEGTEYVSVNLTGGKAYMVTDGTPSWEQIEEAVRKAGYKAQKEVPTEEEDHRQFKKALHRVFLTWGIALPLLIAMLIHMQDGIKLEWMSWVEIVLGLFIMAGPGRKIFKGAFIAITHRHANMDVLVGLGTIAAWSTTILYLYGMPILSFGAMAAMLPAFHLTGRLVEERLRRKAGQDLRMLTGSTSSKANVIGEDGAIISISIDQVKTGMIVRIRTGENIPLDGRIIKGSAAVMQAMITGEPLSVPKSEGDEVIGGTVLESGLLEVEVTKTGQDGFLARMITLVEQAQGVQVPLQALADRISGIFVPVVLLLAIASFAAWSLFYDQLSFIIEWAARSMPWIPVEANAMSVGLFTLVSMLVVACPCALGLATPMAVSIGSGLAARRGLLIKGGQALQTSGELDVLIFDKTGTLTEGRPKVIFSDIDEQDQICIAALESYSVHPLARAIVEWASSSGERSDLPSVSDVKETAGRGISGVVNGTKYSVEKNQDAKAAEGHSGTALQVVRDDNRLGIIVLNDAVKLESAGAVTALLKRNVRPIMATGDQMGTALEVAHHVGIPKEDVRANLQPEDKLRIVQEYQKQGLLVGMIGDGINDAAALKAADVGFAMSAGTDLSMEAGDVVITSGGLEKIVESLEISRLIVKKIKSNLFWAFAYNLVALPATSLALVHPLMAEAAMSLSSAGVVVNSMGIRYSYQRRKI